ncbi:MAG: bi-domain-containing oxidoreductase [Anaerolineales bacterium]
MQDIRNGNIEVMDVPAPTVVDGAVLIRTAASVVSAGTERTLAAFAGKTLAGKAAERPDLVRQVIDKVRREGLLTTIEAVQNRLDQPMPLGYSSAGVIVEVGAGVTDLQPGERVACAGGGHAVHAEYASVPRNLVSPVPAAVSDEAAAFATLGSIALHGFRLADVGVGGRVAVIGLGLLGQLAQRIVRAAGCQAFGVDVSPWRVDFAREHGFEAAIRQDAELAARGVSHGLGFDAVLICADTQDSDPVILAGELARDRGTVVAIGAVGMDIPRRTYYEKELSLRVSRSYGPGRYDPTYEESGVDYPPGYVRWTEGRNLAAFLAMVAEGRLNPSEMITHRFAVAQAAQAYDLIQGPEREQALGIILEYPEAGDAVPAGRIETGKRAAAGDIRLGVIGAGNFASNVLFPKLRGLPRLSLVGLASARGLSSADAARRFGFSYAASDADQLLADESINSIAVLTRHDLHAGQVTAALAAGKHVFCEKPLAITSDELERVRQAAMAADTLLTVGFNRRYAPLLRSMRGLFEPIQEPLVMHYRVNAGPLPADHWLLDPSIGGGRIIGEACHFIDALTYLCGSIPTQVTAQGVSGDQAHQNVALTLQFADGSLGTINYVAGGDPSLGKERVEVFGGGRSAVMDDFRRLSTWAGGRRRVQRAWLRQDKGHRELWAAFVEAAADGGSAPIPYEQLFAVTAATFAAVQSLRSGGTEPVALTSNGA